MEQALHLRQRLASLLDALGLHRNPTKGFWEPCQFGRHLGVDIDSASGIFYAPADKLNRLSRQATRLIGRAARIARWLPVRELQSLAGQAQYLFLAIPAASFFLWELHSVVGDRWGGRVRMTPQLRRDLQWWTSKLQQNGAAATVVAPRWEGKAWHHALTEMAVEELTVAPRAGLFRPGRRDLRARYVTWLGNMGTIKASSLQPYMSAVNNFFKDHGREPMHGFGRSALTLAKALRLELGPTWGTHPSTVVRVELFRASLAVVVLCLFFCRGGAGVECRTGDLTGATTVAYVIGVTMQKIKYFGGWAMESSVVLDYIDPTVLPCPAAWHLVGWLTPWGDQPAGLPRQMAT
eukprot:jgi/Tetstr1/440375/TSEL_028710.t1